MTVSMRKVSAGLSVPVAECGGRRREPGDVDAADPVLRPKPDAARSLDGLRSTGVW